MEPLPADWRTVCTSERMSGSASSRDPGGTALGPRRAHIDGRGHHALQIVALIALAAGGLALVGTLWLASPHGALAFDLQGASGGPAPSHDGPAVSPAAFTGASLLAPSPRSVSAAPSGGLIVDVEGAVRRSGIQRLPAGSRVADAIASAGGYSARADVGAAARSINLAEPLQDGTKVRIPALGDALGAGQAGAADGPSAAPAPGALIDLNHATESQLESLPGVGPVTAGRIVDARTATPFATIDDVATRGAVRQGTLEKLRALVTVLP
jgi:competence protein ComEA